MATFLVLRLQGPLMSFGDVTVDENRPTRSLPSQSQLTGLLANALGWRAREGERLNRLQARLVFGARQDRAGEVLVDYQNAHISPGQAMWRTRSEAPLVRTGLKYDNVQRWRHYIADGAVTVALTLAPSAGEEPTLGQVSRALQRPARPLFLGRAGCPPARPLHWEEIVEAESVPGALSRIPTGNGQGGGLYAEWPADGPLAGDVSLARQVMERADLRDWVADLHTGWRLVATGFVTPAPGSGREAA